MIERLACGYTFADGSLCANDAAGCGHPGDEPSYRCTSADGHEWAIQGDDEEGRCYCLNCGADGDA